MMHRSPPPYWNTPRRVLSDFAALSVVLLCLSCFVSKLPVDKDGNESPSNDEGEHTIPTLLSVVDVETGRYINALENPLYETLTKAAFTTYDYDKQNDVLDFPTIHLDQDAIDLRGDLTVSWTLGRTSEGESIVGDDDVIVLYCGDQAVLEPDINKKQFLEVATIAQAKATSQKHYREGLSVDSILGDNEWYVPRFPVERIDVCQFVLFKVLPLNAYALVASSEILHINNAKATPTAIHLALGNSIDEMVLQFKTGIEGGTPVVQYGVRKDALLLSASGSSHTYTAKDMCEAPATTKAPGKFQPPGQIHVLTLTHLEPNTTYYYKVGIKSEHKKRNTWSEIYSFLSAPEVKANSEPFSYIVYGDQGCPSNGWGQGGAWTAAMTTRELANSLPIRAVHHFGDLSYAKGAAHIWDEWLLMVSSFSTRVPLMVAVGNHEYDHTKGGENGKDPSGVPTPGGYNPMWGNFDEDSGGECGVPTSNHFTMPNTHGNSNGVFWYSYVFANVHTTVISSEHDLSPGSKQYQWLDNDLKSVDKSKTPWLVLELHRPLYESEADPLNSLVGVEMRHRIEDLLKKYKVDLVLAGHYHSYQRTCHGLYKSQCNNGGPVHITVGSAGAQLRHGHLYPGYHWTEKFIMETYGYGRITVTNATALHFEFVQAEDSTDPSAGKVLDETWIIKGASMGLLDHHLNPPKADNEIE